MRPRETCPRVPQHPLATIHHESPHPEPDLPSSTTAQTSRPTRAALLQERALDLLDFRAVRDRVSACATFPPAKRLAGAMSPSHDPHTVRSLQEETAEARILLERGLSLGLPPIEDTPELMRRAELGGTLTGEELLDISALLSATSQARHAIARQREHAPTLADIALVAPDLSDVSNEIAAAIAPDGSVLDGAAPGLGLLRRQIRHAYADVDEAMERVIGTSAPMGALQDRVISVRSERLVLQVKAEMRHRVPGIVHDASNTGATLFVEPLATVDLCNRWRELALEERREVERVLYRLSSLVGSHADDIALATDVTARLEFIVARARYGAEIEGVSLPVQSYDDSPPNHGVLRLAGLRHPLLEGASVPIDVGLGPDWSVLVITGPNAGGKTVAMKSVGLLAQMHQSGLQLPVEEGSWLPVFDGVYADVGDRQSIEESVSTFSSHMRNVIDIMEAATPDSLVLFDELGSSTDPEEGAALAKAILDRMADKGAPTIITTHHRSVAAHAETHDRMMNGSVDLDPATLAPTYRLTLGMPGNSYAMTVAANLGLESGVMKAAESMLDPAFRQFNDWQREAAEERARLRSTLEEAERARAAAESARRDYEARLAEIDGTRRDIEETIRSEVSDRYREVRRRLRRVETALSWTPPEVRRQAPSGSGAPTLEQTSKAAEDLAEIQQQIERVTTPRTEPVTAEADALPLEVGRTAEVRGLGLRGRIETLFPDSGEAEVVIGSLRMRLDTRKLIAVPDQPTEAEERSPGPTPMQFAESRSAVPARDLDMRGARVEPALLELDSFLERASADGLGAVRVVHGHGTGALRSAVREFLGTHTLVASHRPEVRERGGNGATVVELV